MPGPPKILFHTWAYYFVSNCWLMPKGIRVDLTPCLSVMATLLPCPQIPGAAGFWDALV